MEQRDGDGPMMASLRLFAGLFVALVALVALALVGAAGASRLIPALTHLNLEMTPDPDRTSRGLAFPESQGLVTNAVPRAEEPFSDPCLGRGSFPHAEAGSGLSASDYTTWLDSFSPPLRAEVRGLTGCVGRTTSSLLVETIRSGRRARGGDITVADVRWIRAAPLEALELVLSAGDGAAPTVVDGWDQLEALEPEVRAAVAVAVALASEMNDIDAIRVLVSLPEDALHVVVDSPAIAAGVLQAEKAATVDCLYLLRDHGQAGLAAATFLREQGALNRCGQIGPVEVSWFVRSDVPTGDLAARVGSVARVSSARDDLSRELDWPEAYADWAIEGLARAHVEDGLGWDAAWERTIRTVEGGGLPTCPIPLIPIS